MRPDTRFTGPELCALPAREVVGLLRRRELSPDELISASLARIEAVDGAVNAVVTRGEDRARAAARKVSSESPLAGLPLGIKDLTDVAGMRTTYGTRAMAEHVPDRSDPLVTRIEARGGVVLGKTNTPELGAGANTFNEVFGATRNPWNTALNAGGSSGGAAVSLATGALWLSHGSDFGGSLRSPANYCGVVGLRPSPGVAGGSGGMAFATGGVQGPMARDVLDCALFLDVMSGFDACWPISWPAPEIPYAETARRDPGALRIGYSADLNGFAALTDEIDAVLRAALHSCERAGVAVDEGCPDMPGLNEAFRAMRCLSFLGDYQVTPPDVSRHFKATIMGNLADARALSFADYVSAERARGGIYAGFLSFFESFDVLACPVNGLAPLPVEIEYPTEVAGRAMGDYIDWLRFAFPATVAGLPALSLPVGFTPAGLPVGLQLIGPPRGEARLLQIAHHLERVLDLPVTCIDPMGPSDG